MNIFDILNNGESHPLIPTRDLNAVTGSDFIKNNMNLTGIPRNKNIVSEFLSGNIPDFLRKFTPVTVTEGSNSIIYLVMSDVLSIGSDTDYVRMPMDPHMAQTIADKYDCTMPTRKMVNDIWKASANKLEPKPWGPPYDQTMMTTQRINDHNTRVQNQLNSLSLDYTKLTSGHKKDVILSNQVAPNNPNKRVVIYGFIKLDGTPIQQLNATSHLDLYFDYSHSIRMICNDVIINDKPMRIQDIFSDPKLSSLISDEGPLTFQRY